MTKPFNLADAKLGHPVQTASGAVATILKFDGRDDDYKLIGTHNQWDHATRWKEDGENESSSGSRLIMAPVGTIDGKPVYPGDMISVRGCEPFPAPYGPTAPKVEWSRASWPQSYPVTRLTADMLWRMYSDADSGRCPDDVVLVVNQAIKHGIDNDYLIDARELAEALPGAHDTPDMLQVVRNLVADLDVLTKDRKEQNNILGKIAHAVGIIGCWDQDVLPQMVNERLRNAIQAAYYKGHYYGATVGLTQPFVPPCPPAPLDPLAVNAIIAQVN